MDASAPRARDAFEGRGSRGNDVHVVPTVEGEHKWLGLTGDGTAVVSSGVYRTRDEYDTKNRQHVCLIRDLFIN